MPTAGRLVAAHGSATVVRVAVVVARRCCSSLPAVMPTLALLAVATFLLGLANGVARRVA